MNERNELSREALLNQIFDYLHLTILQYGLWFQETEHQIGLDAAIETDAAVWDRVFNTTLKRFASHTSTPLSTGIPEVIANLPEKSLQVLADEMSKNFVASDGVWFQHIEKNYDYEMFATKRINDSNWVRFSNLEAKMILRRHGLLQNGGLSVLKEALSHRIVARICKYSFEEAPDRLVLLVNSCRIHEARNRKNLAVYNCKSSGVAEYSYFARAVDKRAHIRCLGCPPDPHPESWYCAWEFTIK